MENYTNVSEVLSKVDNAIYNTTGGLGYNASGIYNKSFESHHIRSMLLIALLPMASFFIFVILLKSTLELSGQYLILGGGLFAILVSFCSLFFQLKRGKKLKSTLSENMQKKVDISEQVLDIMYDRISLLVDIERKYDVNIEELDKIRNRFYKTMVLTRKHDDIDFLNPQNIIHNDENSEN